MVQGVLKNSAAALVFQLLNRGLGFLCFIWIARLMGVENIGHFTYILSLCALLTLFVEFGTNQFLVKKVAANSVKLKFEELKPILLLKLIQFLVGSALLICFEFDTLITNFTPLNLVLIYVFFDSFAQTGISILNGRKEFIRANKFAFAYESGRSLILLTVLFLTNSSFAIPVVYISVAIIYACFISIQVFAETFSKEQFLIPDTWTKLKNCYRQTYLFFLAAIAFQLYFRIDMLLLKRISTDYELGTYGVAYKFFEVFLFVPAIVSGIVYPQAVELFKTGHQKLSDYLTEIQLKATCLLSVPVILLILSSNYIIALFFGPSFVGASNIMKVLFLTSFVFCFNFVYQVAFNASGKERFALYTYLVGFLLNIGLNYWLIPHFGALGAAYATLLAELSVTIIFILFSFRQQLRLLNPLAASFVLLSIALAVSGVSYLIIPFLIFVLWYVFRSTKFGKSSLQTR